MIYCDYLKTLLALLFIILGFSLADANEKNYLEHTVLGCISEKNEKKHKKDNPYSVFLSYYSYDGYNLNFLGRAKEKQPHFKSGQ